jgi:hypothetical protein
LFFATGYGRRISMKLSASDWSWLMSKSFDNAIRAVVLIALSSVGVIYYLRHIHPVSIPEWIFIPLAVIELLFLVWRKPLKLDRHRVVTATVRCLLAGDVFAIFWMHDKSGLLTALCGILFAIALFSVLSNLRTGLRQQAGSQRAL